MSDKGRNEPSAALVLYRDTQTCRHGFRQRAAPSHLKISGNGMSALSRPRPRTRPPTSASRPGWLKSPRNVGFPSRCSPVLPQGLISSSWM
jgi:hypothetical protein